MGRIHTLSVLKRKKIQIAVQRQKKKKKGPVKEAQTFTTH